MGNFSFNLKQLASSDIPVCSFDLVKSVDTEICFISGKNRDFCCCALQAESIENAVSHPRSSNLSSFSDKE